MRSLSPLPDLTWIVFSSKLISWIFRLTHSETLKPDDSINSINKRCFLFFVVFYQKPVSFKI